MFCNIWSIEVFIFYFFPVSLLFLFDKIEEFQIVIAQGRRASISVNKSESNKQNGSLVFQQKQNKKQSLLVLCRQPTSTVLSLEKDA